MSQTRNLLTEVRTASRQQIFETIKWLAWMVVGGLLPLWGGYLYLLLLGQPVALSHFTSKGEFALYSAAFLMPALYSAGRDVGNPFVHRQNFLLIGIVMLLMSSILFTAATAAVVAGSDSADIHGIQLRTDMLIYFSMGLFAVTIFFALLANLLDSIQLGFDPAVYAARDRKSLQDDYRAMEGDDGEQ